MKDTHGLICIEVAGQGCTAADIAWVAASQAALASFGVIQVSPLAVSTSVVVFAGLGLACAAAFKAASCVAEVKKTTKADHTSAFMAAPSEVIDIS